MNLTDNVTLICVDTINLKRAIATLEYCKSLMTFKYVELISSLPGKYEHLVPISPTILSAADPLSKYSEFCIRELYKYFDTSHCLIVQYDGWIVNPEAWQDDWLNYDYIGCQTLWTEPGEEGKGGNGGFSLRSRKLLQMASHVVKNPHAEDQALSMADPTGMRNSFEEMGFNFAPARVQKKFGIELEECSGQFGHHQGFVFNLLNKVRNRKDL